MSEAPTSYCSFCGKSQHEVTKLIAGPAVFICNECVSLCNEIIRSDEVKKLAAEAAEALIADIRRDTLERLADLKTLMERRPWWKKLGGRA